MHLSTRAYSRVWLEEVLRPYEVGSDREMYFPLAGDILDGPALCGPSLLWGP